MDKKIWEFTEWNQSVLNGDIEEDFDRDILSQKTYKLADLYSGNPKIGMIDMNQFKDLNLALVLIPIACPSHEGSMSNQECKSKLHDVYLDGLGLRENMNEYFLDTDKLVRCTTCGWKGFRKVPSK